MAPLRFDKQIETLNSWLDAGKIEIVEYSPDSVQAMTGQRLAVFLVMDDITKPLFTVNAWQELWAIASTLDTLVEELLISQEI